MAAQMAILHPPVGHSTERSKIKCASLETPVKGSDKTVNTWHCDRQSNDGKSIELILKSGMWIHLPNQKFWGSKSAFYDIL